MREEVLNAVWEKMQTAKKLNDEEKDIYIFGFYQGVIFLLNICTALCIGVALDMLAEVCTYLACFLPLRIFAGGYHAKSQLRCYVMSSFTTVGILLLIRFLQQQSSYLEGACFLVAFSIIWHFAPVEDKNKPLADKEKIRYQKYVKGILIFLAVLAGVTYLLDKKMINSVITVSTCFLSIILLMGVRKNCWMAI